MDPKIFDKVPLTKKAATKLGISTDLLAWIKEGALPVSHRMSHMMSTYFGTNELILISAQASSPFNNALLEEFEFLSMQPSMFKALRSAEGSSFYSNWMIDQIQNANSSLQVLDPLSKIAMNMTNQLATQSMNENSLDVNSYQFPLLSPLPWGNSNVINEFFRVSKDLESGKETYTAIKEELPVYVKQVISTSNDFKPVYVNGEGRRTFLAPSQKNTVQITLRNTNGRLEESLNRLLPVAIADKKHHPSMKGFTFDGYTIRGSLLKTHPDYDAKTMRLQEVRDAPLIGVKNDTLTVHYVPVEMGSSGVNNFDIHYRPSTSTLWMLSQIPGMIYGKK